MAARTADSGSGRRVIPACLALFALIACSPMSSRADDAAPVTPPPAAQGPSTETMAEEPTVGPTSVVAGATTIERGRLLFGLGTTADYALSSALAQRAPVRLLTTWFNSTADLEWLGLWEDTLIPQTYADGYAHQVIVFDGGATGTTQTRYGEACGQLYALSAQFLEDMQRLATIFRGDGPLYVTMFTELQTYPCEHNQWQGSEAYYQALKDQYLAAMDIFHRRNPNAMVGLSWGGWQGRWDDSSVGGGRSLIGHFADVLRRSDYQAFQAMQSDSNVEDIRVMTDLLSPYGPVLLAHYLPDDESTSVWDEDLSTVFTDDYVADITRRGLFGFAFMDPLLVNADDERMQRAVDVVRRHAASGLVPPALAGADERIAGACPAGLPASGFLDIGGSAHRQAIDCLAWWDITTGTSTNQYAPGREVTRGQFASFLVRLLDQSELAPTNGLITGFPDVGADHPHRDAIERLAGLGVVQGTADGGFAPDDAIRRGQMAAMLVRLHEDVLGMSVTTDSQSFTDIATSPHETAIRKLVVLDVTAGYADGSFRPGRSTTRGQMASFLVRYLARLAEDGVVEVPPL